MRGSIGTLGLVALAIAVDGCGRSPTVPRSDAGQLDAPNASGGSVGTGGSSLVAGSGGSQAGTGGTTPVGAGGTALGGTGGASGGGSGTAAGGSGGARTGGSVGGGGFRAGGRAGTGGAGDGGTVGTGGSVGGTVSTGGSVGGSVGTGGSVGGVSGTGGSSSVAGASGTAGAIGTGGAGGTCTGCQPNESCWADGSGSRCIESAVPLPIAFAIDATEVTRGQYAAWLGTKPVTTLQAAVCGWNTSFTPDATCMAKSSVCQGTTTCATHPQPCIDMCDAAAYCKAVGRRLCTDTEWTKACSSNGAYEAGRETGGRGTCNDYTTGSTTTVPVASLPGCQPPASSGFAGVFDMIGNVEEWVDNCFSSDGASDVCKPRGLPFGMGAAAPLCSQSTYADRSQAKDTVGFRCCAS